MDVQVDGHKVVFISLITYRKDTSVTGLFSATPACEEPDFPRGSFLFSGLRLMGSGPCSVLCCVPGAGPFTVLSFLVFIWAKWVKLPPV